MNKCVCCGSCCRNGGPPLHGQDIELIRAGILTFDDLVTIRRGEFVLPPLATKPVSAKSEWIKIGGVEGSWTCRFLDASSDTCTIYKHRPGSCQALKCWDTAEILAMTGHDLLSRFDLMEPDDPLMVFVQTQESACPVPDLEELIAGLDDNGRHHAVLQDLTRLVEEDLRIRTVAVRKYTLSVAREMFYFGRPLFQLLQPLGISAAETRHGLRLEFQRG